MSGRYKFLQTEILKYLTFRKFKNVHLNMGGNRIIWFGAHAICLFWLILYKDLPFDTILCFWSLTFMRGMYNTLFVWEEGTIKRNFAWEKIWSLRWAILVKRHIFKWTLVVSHWFSCFVVFFEFCFLEDMPHFSSD